VSEPSRPGARPRPHPSPLTRPFWEATARGEFRIQVCERCEARIFYARHACTQCGARELRWQASSGRGTVYSYTIARRPTHPAFAARVPYVIAIVELEEGPRVTTNIIGCDPDAVAIGMPVEVAFEEAQDGIAIPVFRPRAAGSAPPSR
jgi:uncharacterized protein